MQEVRCFVTEHPWPFFPQTTLAMALLVTKQYPIKDEVADTASTNSHIVLSPQNVFSEKRPSLISEVSVLPLLTSHSIRHEIWLWRSIKLISNVCTLSFGNPTNLVYERHIKASSEIEQPLTVACRNSVLPPLSRLLGDRNAEVGTRYRKFLEVYPSLPPAHCHNFPASNFSTFQIVPPL